MSTEETTVEAESPKAVQHRLEVEATAKDARKFAVRTAGMLAVAAFALGCTVYGAGLLAHTGLTTITWAIAYMTLVFALAVYWSAANFFQYKEAMFDLNVLTRND